MDLVAAVRRFISEFYEFIGEARRISDVALATHELLENAVRYADSDETFMHVAYFPETRRLRIHTENTAAEDQLEALKKLFAAMKQSDDPASFYRSVMEEAMTRDDHESGLGLARIQAEAGMDLDYRVEGNRLIIVAEANLGETP